MPSSLQDRDWDVLIKRIAQGKCTPFLGAGANYPLLPLGGQIAATWAKEKKFPFASGWDDLPKVAQFAAITDVDPMAVKEELVERWFTNVPPPDFRDPRQPLRILAELPLPIYLTTNYDNFMLKALESVSPPKTPRRELCRWNSHPSVRRWPSVWDQDKGYRPTPHTPVVYHLHGLDELPQSLVLTEDDYLDYLVTIADQREDLLPAFVQEALTGSSLLFLGYKLADVTFQVIFRGLVSAMESELRMVSVSVQLQPDVPAEMRENVQNYLDQYYGKEKVRVYWGAAENFAQELRDRWSKFNADRAA
jgi:hypothetical protein